MKKIIILGNTSKAFVCAEKLRHENKGYVITILTTDGAYPYDETKLSFFAGEEISLKDISVKPKDFYEKNNIHIVSDKKFTRINTKRSRIFGEDKEQWEYDVLIIVDLPNKRFPDIKGTNKEGLYNFRSLTHLENLIKKYPFTETVVVETNSVEGFKFAASLVKKGKEVVVVSSETQMDIPEDLRSLLTNETARFQTCADNAIAEILGDSDIKAVRLKSGKVLGCQAVAVESMREDYRIFSDWDITESISANEYGETSIENIFVVQNVLQAEGACSKILSKEAGVTPVGTAQEI
jgi:NAD(P)H-nitrite reductase large subunit